MLQNECFSALLSDGELAGESTVPLLHSLLACYAENLGSNMCQTATAVRITALRVFKTITAVLCTQGSHSCPVLKSQVSQSQVSCAHVGHSCLVLQVEWLLLLLPCSGMAPPPRGWALCAAVSSALQLSSVVTCLKPAGPSSPPSSSGGSFMFIHPAVCLSVQQQHS